MNTESFEKTVRTFGASPSRWETEQTDELAEWARTDGKEIAREEQTLDNALNLVAVPEDVSLTDRIQQLVAKETMRRQIVLFWKISPWISFTFMLCGFSLGWYQHHLDYINMQSYFDTLFDTVYEQY